MRRCFFLILCVEIINNSFPGVLWEADSSPPGDGLLVVTGTTESSCVKADQAHLMVKFRETRSSTYGRALLFAEFLSWLIVLFLLGFVFRPPAHCLPSPCTSLRPSSGSSPRFRTGPGLCFAAGPSSTHSLSVVPPPDWRGQADCHCPRSLQGLRLSLCSAILEGAHGTTGLILCVWVLAQKNVFLYPL